MAWPGFDRALPCEPRPPPRYDVASRQRTGTEKRAASELRTNHCSVTQSSAQHPNPMNTMFLPLCCSPSAVSTTIQRQRAVPRCERGGGGCRGGRGGGPAIQPVSHHVCLRLMCPCCLQTTKGGRWCVQHPVPWRERVRGRRHPANAADGPGRGRAVRKGAGGAASHPGRAPADAGVHRPPPAAPG